MPLNGIPSSLRSSLASSSVLAEVTTITSNPLIFLTLSKSISGKMMCSLIPSEKLPLPSNALSLTPLKSLIRGIVMFTSLSRKFHMLSLLRVTFEPIGIPSLSFHEARDFLATVVAGF